jgi:hypothetical protein
MGTRGLSSFMFLKIVRMKNIVVFAVILFFTPSKVIGAEILSPYNAYLIEKGEIAFGFVQYPLTLGIHERLNLFLFPLIFPFIKMAGFGMKIKLFEKGSFFSSGKIAYYRDFTLPESGMGIISITSYKIKEGRILSFGIFFASFKTLSESYKFGHTYTFGVVPFVLEIKIIKQLAFTIKSSAQISPLGSRLSRGETSLISSLVAISDFMQFEIGPEIHNFKEIMAYFDLVFRFKIF